jgi:glyoxylase-like metal-dependent hydrolase (beta-lactamase superfamily II)
MSQPNIHSFFDPVTGTISHVAYDAPGGRAAIIDPVLDYDPNSGRTRTESAEAIVQFVQAQDLTVDWILETHAHADHLSAAHWLKAKVGGRTGIGAAIGRVQAVFKPLFNLETDFATDGRQFDHLFHDGDRFAIGTLHAEVMAVPGHTPADVAYKVGDAVFIGDTLFMPDVGSARCDFPGGDAATLYRSAKRLLDLPPETRLYLCHDYPPAGRAPQWITTVAEQRAHNIHLRDDIDEATFVALRTARDATLAMPVLILPAIQVNIRAGELPPPDRNGTRYLRIPLNVL